MFDSIIEKKKLEAEKLAEMKKSEAEYVANVAEEYYDILTEIFNPNNKVSSGNLEEIIFENTLKCIEKINEYCMPIGVVTYYGDARNYNDALYKLGWIDLEGVNVYFVRPTKKGFELLDKLREIRGQLL